MIKQGLVYAQYILPHHLITKCVGWLADSHIQWLKNLLINYFIRIYNVDMSEAMEQNATSYPTFNDFFTRHINLEKRAIHAGKDLLISPADGEISQLGKIKTSTLVKVKDFYFDLPSLLGGDEELTQLFNGGSFATLYLGPANYHRVHMPVSGRLLRTIFIPGRLFSVNRLSSKLIPNLYSRNERYISVFETEHGKMAVILVGALIVGSIQVAWQDKPVRKQHIYKENGPACALEQGAELGYFKLGSSVIILLEPQKVTWQPNKPPYAPIKFGQILGRLSTIRI